MGFFSSIGSAVSSVARGVAKAGRAVFERAREMAGKAIGWMAEKAEGFVDGAKNVWKAVKPYVEHIRVALKAAAVAVSIPWVKAALIGLEKGLGALTAFENSPIAKKSMPPLSGRLNSPSAGKPDVRNRKNKKTYCLSMSWQKPDVTKKTCVLPSVKSLPLNNGIKWNWLRRSTTTKSPKRT